MCCRIVNDLLAPQGAAVRVVAAEVTARLKHQHPYRQRTFERASMRLEGVLVPLTDDMIAGAPKRIDRAVDEIDRGARLMPSAPPAP